MTELELSLARCFRTKLEEGLGSRFLRLRAFGSRARGISRPDSDFDLLVLVDRVDSETRRKVADWASDVMMESDEFLCLSPLVMDPERLTRLSQRERLLARDIESDGVEL